MFDVAHTQTSAPVAEFATRATRRPAALSETGAGSFRRFEDGTWCQNMDLRAPPRCKTTFACTDGKGDAVACHSACLRWGGDEIASSGDKLTGCGRLGRSGGQMPRDAAAGR